MIQINFSTKLDQIRSNMNNQRFQHFIPDSDIKGIALPSQNEHWEYELSSVQMKDISIYDSLYLKESVDELQDFLRVDYGMKFRRTWKKIHDLGALVHANEHFIKKIAHEVGLSVDKLNKSLIDLSGEVFDKIDGVSAFLDEKATDYTNYVSSLIFSDYSKKINDLYEYVDEVSAALSLDYSDEINDLSTELTNLVDDVSTDLNEKIDDETSSRKASDDYLSGEWSETLSSNTLEAAKKYTDVVSSVLDKNISDEIVRAEANEQAISTALNNEIEEARKNEKALSGRLSTAEDEIEDLQTNKANLSTLTEEIARAKAAEASVLTDAKAYTDIVSSAIDQAYKAADIQVLSDAKKYTDDVSSVNYAAWKNEWEAADSSTLASAKTYVNEEISALDVADTARTGEFVTAVSQTDGKISVVRKALNSSDIPELSQDKINGLNDRLSNIEDNVSNIVLSVSDLSAEFNNTSTYINAQDKVVSSFAHDELTAVSSDLASRINSIHVFDISVVTEIPAVDIAKPYTIYFVPSPISAENNIYNEFILVSSETYLSMEQIGSTKFDPKYIQDQIDEVSGNVDTVSASLSNYLPLSGGTVSGLLNVKSSFNNGRDCVISGDYSHVEGYETEIYGDYSHSEGFNTHISGDFSHAEGSETIVNGYASHAEGYRTYSKSGHAEGSQTSAIGIWSHSEGLSTLASGNYSHAEGCNTSALMSCTHTDGINSKAIHPNSYVWGGNQNSYQSNGDGTFNIKPKGYERGFYIGSQNLPEIIVEYAVDNNNAAYKTGDLTMHGGNLFIKENEHTGEIGDIYKKWQEFDEEIEDFKEVSAKYITNHDLSLDLNNYLPLTGGTISGNIDVLSSFTIGSRDNYSKGKYSFANGEEVRAYGDYTHAEGLKSQANGKYSHAEGMLSKTESNATYSHVDGIKATAKTPGTYVWQGLSVSNAYNQPIYLDHGQGTFNINPKGGTSGFFIGDKNLDEIISEKAPVTTYVGGTGISIEQNTISISEEYQNTINEKADSSALNAHTTNEDIHVTADEKEEWNAISNDIVDLQNNKANASDIPSKTSDLTNDSGFITSNDVPEYTAGNGISISNHEIAVSGDYATISYVDDNFATKDDLNNKADADDLNGHINDDSKHISDGIYVKTVNGYNGNLTATLKDGEVVNFVRQSPTLEITGDNQRKSSLKVSNDEKSSLRASGGYVDASFIGYQAGIDADQDSKINSIETTAKDAQSAAEAAAEAAGAAQAAASAADAKADNAQTTANNAQTAAANAQSTANAAQTTADQAATAASAAQSAASAAQSAAQSAQSTAESAQSVAATAQTAANNAMEAAQSVTGRVDTLENTVDEHDSTIKAHAQSIDTNANNIAILYSSLGNYLPLSGGIVSGKTEFTNSFINGLDCSASYNCGHAEGYATSALADYSHTEGISAIAKEGDDHSYVFNGNTSVIYESNGAGTFNLNPVGGVYGIYVGDEPLPTYCPTRDELMGMYVPQQHQSWNDETKFFEFNGWDVYQKFYAKNGTSETEYVKINSAQIDLDNSYGETNIHPALIELYSQYGSKSAIGVTGISTIRETYSEVEENPIWVLSGYGKDQWTGLCHTEIRPDGIETNGLKYIKEGYQDISSVILNDCTFIITKTDSGANTKIDCYGISVDGEPITDRVFQMKSAITNVISETSSLVDLSDDSDGNAIMQRLNTILHAINKLSACI